MRQIAKVRAASARSTGPGADFWSQVFNLLENQLTFGSKAHLFANLKIFKSTKILDFDSLWLRPPAALWIAYQESSTISASGSI